MEEAEFEVRITPEAEQYFWELTQLLYSTHDSKSAEWKLDEILSKANSLNHFPLRGSLEPKLQFLKRGHRYLVYHISKNYSVKIIYQVDVLNRFVHITDFFPTKADDNRMPYR